jgi:6,7-dimethyl-8-ribityllumazine synthase
VSGHGRFDGKAQGTGVRLGIVVARFNEAVTERLLVGAIATGRQCGVQDGDVIVARVPGAFEIPLAAQVLAGSGRVDAVVCLGAVIRGETAHFDYVAGECARGIQDVALKSGLPVLFGVLTTDTMAQADARSGVVAGSPSNGNKGAECVRAALEMVSVLRQLQAGA